MTSTIVRGNFQRPTRRSAPGYPSRTFRSSKARVPSAGLKPWHFIKPAASCIRGTGETITLPADSKKVGWEAEIAVVIGRACSIVGVEQALDHVAGLSIVNDLSARDHLRRAGVAIESPFHFDRVSQ